MKSLVARFLPVVLLSVWLLSSPAAPLAADATDDPDEQFLREAKFGTDSLQYRYLNLSDVEGGFCETVAQSVSRCPTSGTVSEAREKQP